MGKIISFPDLCGGCNYCSIVCAFMNRGACNPKKSSIRVVRIEPGIDFPVVCHQCHKPPCSEPCPVSAIYRDEDRGVVLIDREKCIGCGECVPACPFGAITMHPEVGTPIKCDLCGNGDPQCVKYCLKGAIVFSDEDWTSSKKRKEKALKDAKRMMHKHGLTLLC